MLCRIDRRRVSVWSRNEKDWTEQFQNVVEAVKSLKAASAMLDGEIVIVAGIAFEAPRPMKTFALNCPGQKDIGVRDTWMEINPYFALVDGTNQFARTSLNSDALLITDLIQLPISFELRRVPFWDGP